METSVWNFLFGLIGTLTGTAVTSTVAWLKLRRADKLSSAKGFEQRLKLIERGQTLLMRSDLIRLHDVFTKRGYCPVSIKLSVREEYDGYHALGGNGIVTRLMEEIASLPDDPPKSAVKKEAAYED